MSSSGNGATLHLVVSTIHCGTLVPQDDIGRYLGLNIARGREKPIPPWPGIPSALCAACRRLGQACSSVHADERDKNGNRRIGNPKNGQEHHRNSPIPTWVLTFVVYFYHSLGVPCSGFPIHSLGIWGPSQLRAELSF